MTKAEALEQPIDIRLASMGLEPITCFKGKAYLRGEGGSLITLNNVLLAPHNTTCNILSINAATEACSGL